jgi:di/tricarboxylate transporter
MLVEPGSPLAGKTIGEAGLRNLGGVYLMEIEREHEIIPAVAPSARLHERDRLVFVGVVDSMIELKRIQGLVPATDQVFKLNAPTPERCLIEAVVSNSCPFLNTSIRDARFRSHYDAAVIAVARNGARIRKKIGDIELQIGDTLLLETHPSFVDRNRDSRDFFLISKVEGSEPPRFEQAWAARLVLLFMVVVVATSALSILKASLLAAVAMVTLGCCRGPEVTRAIDLSVLLAIGAGLGVGKAMAVSGAATLLAGYMVSGLGGFGHEPLAVLAAIYGVTMLFTNVITGKAAAVLVFPIAVAASSQLDVALMPFAIAVVIASAASFATPIASQTNLIVFGPGGYRAHDFLRLGLPLSVLAWVLTVLITPYIWSF